MRSYYSLFIIIFLFIVSCKKEEVSVSQIITNNVSILSSNSIRITGEVKNIGSRGVVDYGVVYSNSNYNLDANNSTKVSFGKELVVGQFTKDINNVYFDNNSYQNNIYVRAYITDNNGTIYGNIINVEFPAATTSAITPSSGKSGDRIKILGNFYDPTLSNTIVRFESVEAKVLSVNTKEIEVEVPSTIRQGHGSVIGVSVKVGNSQSYANTPFTILANIKDFIPKSGPVGTSISFIGDNLPQYYNYSNSSLKIEIGGKQVGNEVFNVYVPHHASFEPMISFIAGGEKRDIGKFSILKPSITEVSPNMVYPSESFSIKGNNLPMPNNIYYPTVKLKIGSIDLNYAYINNNSYSGSIPEDFKAGEYNISLTVDDVSIAVPSKIVVKDIRVESFSPSSGRPGDEIRVKGEFKQGRLYHVHFGNVYVMV